MRNRYFGVAFGVAATLMAALPAARAAEAIVKEQGARSVDPGPLGDRKKTLGYAIGVTTARNLLKDGVEFDPALVQQGIQDAFKGGNLLLTDKQIATAMNDILAEMRQRSVANKRELELANKKSGEAYREKFAKQEGVKTLPNGVLYKVVKMGTGAKPTEEDSIVAHYRGTLIGGAELQADEGKPLTLQMSKLIMGLRETLKQMPTGSKWTIVVPPSLAYGTRGVGTNIGPNETLVFDVELLSILK